MEVQLSTLSENAQKLIAAQRTRYVDSMPGKREVIRQCMRQMSAGLQSGQPGNNEKLFQQVHRLAGSAGSYGFEDLGQAASVVDRYLIANSAQLDDLPELFSLLEKLLDEIDNIIQKGK